MGPGCDVESQLRPLRLAVSRPFVPMLGYWNWIVLAARSRTTRNVSISGWGPPVKNAPTPSHSTTNLPPALLHLIAPKPALGESWYTTQSAQYGAIKFFGMNPARWFVVSARP